MDIKASATARVSAIGKGNNRCNRVQRYYYSVSRDLGVVKHSSWTTFSHPGSSNIAEANQVQQYYRIKDGSQRNSIGPTLEGKSRIIYNNEAIGRERLASIVIHQIFHIFPVSDTFAELKIGGLLLSRAFDISAYKMKGISFFVFKTGPHISAHFLMRSILLDHLLSF